MLKYEKKMNSMQDKNGITPYRLRGADEGCP
jgi:hypothetical protein